MIRRLWRRVRGDGETPTCAVPVGELLNIVANPRRRWILDVLDEHGPVPLRDLATRVAVREYAKVPEDLTKAEYKRVYIAVQQTHIDRLEAAGVVRVDRFDHWPIVVRPGPDFEATRSVVRYARTVCSS